MFLSNQNASGFIAFFISPNLPVLIPSNAEIGEEQKHKGRESRDQKKIIQDRGGAERWLESTAGD